jgi:pyruvate,orthophosphate dikinase
MYGSVVLGVDHHQFEEIIEHVKLDRRRSRTELTAEDWRAWSPATRTWSRRKPASRSRRTRRSSCGARSARCSARWMNARQSPIAAARHPGRWGTAVNVQAMVFGNMGDDCATGVCFTRDPSTGENMFYGEFLVNAQGEDVVAGIRTPQPLSSARQAGRELALPAMEEAMPEAYAELMAVRERWKSTTATCRTSSSPCSAEQAVHAADPQRQAHRRGALRIAVEMAKRGPDRPRRGGAAGQSRLAGPVAAPDARPEGAAHVLAKGLPASPGAASGAVVFTPTRPKAAPPRARR